MASESEILCDSGPKSPSVNWNDTQYRRCVLAKLVEGVYILETYRHQYGDVPQGLALPSWDSCGFHLKEWLIDNDGIGKSIICATYEYKSPSPDDPNIPQYVIAFRGTILKSKDTMFRDIEVNTQCVYNRLHKNPSFQNAMQYVQNQNTDALSRGASLWLAGHSLGSAMALLIGKKMVRMDYFLETYLFDPPFYSVSVKFALHIMKSVLKAGASKLVPGIGRQHHEAQAHEDPFDKLSNWFPHLFVNRYDPICKVYIKYFKNRKKMEKIGMGKLERHATKQSLMELFTNVFGYSDSEAEALHLLPSVNLIINKGQFRRAHGIQTMV
uniref:Fungal lipase-type domain-containing protein n=1 Tax=Fagus sylvatica TaxID=28930 RepID=A0A2N9IVQ6_FAGSY